MTTERTFLKTLRAGDSFRSLGAFRDSRCPGSARRTLQGGLYSSRRQRIEHNGNCQRFGNYARRCKNTPPARSFDVEGHSFAGAAAAWPGDISIQRGKETMGITCEEVWREISDYVDHELDAKRRTALEEHFAEC